MLEHDGLRLEGFDQDLWARTGDYASREPHDSLTLFRLLRQANVKFLRQIGPEKWQCSGVHSERGRITIRDLAVRMAGHDLNHIEQIRTILGSRVRISHAHQLCLTSLRRFVHSSLSA